MSERATPEADAAEAKRRAEWLRKHKAHKDWIILSVSEVTVIRNALLKLERERAEARKELSLKQQTLTIAKGTLSDLRKELNEWQTLCLWGGTPEHIHDFIKGQQTRIHEAQDIEKTCEQLERERNEALIDRANGDIATMTINHYERILRERDEARELLRILAGLVAYGLGQSGEEWSLEAMRQATSAIQNAKSLEESK